MTNLITASYNSLGIEFKYDANTNAVEGMDKLDDVYCSPAHHKDHRESLEKLAKERNNGDIGPVVRYRETPTREWMCAPEIKAYFAVHWA